MVPPPVPRGQVHASVAIKITRCDAQPKTRPLGEALNTGRQSGATQWRIPSLQSAPSIAEQANRPPGRAHRQIRPCIVIQVGENHAIDQTQFFKSRLDPQTPTPVLQQKRRRRLRITPRDFPNPDEDFQLSIPVHIGRRHGTHRAGATAEDFTAHSGRQVHDPDRAAIGDPVLTIADAGQDYPAQHHHSGLIPRGGLEQRWIGKGREASMRVVGEHPKRSTLTGGNEEIVPPIPVEVGPSDARSSLAEVEGLQRLASKFIKWGIGMDMRQAVRNRLEQRRYRRWRNGSNRLLLCNLHNTGANTGASGHPSIAPSHLDVRRCRRAQRKAPHRVIPRQIATARHYLLGLHREPLGHHPDLGPDTPGIPGNSSQSNSHSRCRGPIAVELRWLIQGVQHKVQIPIAIQIGRGHALLDPGRIEAPGLSHLFEGQIPAIAEGGIGRIEPGEHPTHVQDFEETHFPARFHRLGAGPDIHIEHVHLVAVGDEEILIPVQIDIQE